MIGVRGFDFDLKRIVKDFWVKRFLSQTQLCDYFGIGLPIVHIYGFVFVIVDNKIIHRLGRV